jgi:hypothetical protein
MNKLILIILFIVLNTNISANEKKTVTINDEKEFIKIIANEFSKYEPIKNERALIKIKIDKFGNLDYKIIENFKDKERKEYLINFLEDKKKIKFPNFRNKNKVIEMELKGE